MAASVATKKSTQTPTTAPAPAPAPAPAINFDGYDLDELSIVFTARTKEESIDYLYGFAPEVLMAFASSLGVATTGQKPALSNRIWAAVSKHKPEKPVDQPRANADTENLDSNLGSTSRPQEAAKADPDSQKSAPANTGGGDGQRNADQRPSAPEVAEVTDKHQRFAVRVSHSSLSDEDLDTSLRGWAILAGQNIRGLSRDQKEQLISGFIQLGETIIPHDGKSADDLLPSIEEFIADYYTEPEQTNE